ncbi:MAG: flagellar hook-associated protein FlgK [Candidatus Brocadiaceae bacterium]|nr:flagellar hook-associated protein FlgK [Candidatus Brocadiaceae bacterium]
MSSDLQIGLSGVLTAQRAMLVTAHNISNANTKGYSKQTAILSSRQPIEITAGTLGQGVQLAKIKRNRDEYLESRLRDIGSSLGSASVKSQYFKELETILNENAESSLNNAILTFFRYANDLSQNPESISVRASLMETSNTLTDTFRRISTELDQMKTFVKQGIEDQISDINNITKSIAGLNKEIAIIESKGIESNDLLDKRDALLQDISTIINIRTEKNSDGTVDVTSSGGLLVSGASSLELAYKMETDSTVSIIAANNESARYTPTDGEISGLLEMNNTTIVNYDKKINTLAAAFIKEVNKIHSEGVGLSGGFSSVLSDNAVSSASVALKSAGLSITPTSGDLYVTVIDSSGVMTKTKVTVDVSVDTLTSVQTSLDAITGISANITDKRLQVLADSGYSFNFSYALDPNPATGSITGTTIPSISGVYSGSSNDVYTFTAIGTGGTIGSTAGLQVEIRDSSSNLITTLDVGSGYTAGNTLDVGNGVSVSFAAGTLNVNDTFTLDVIHDSDGTDLLAALGINTFFNGTDASDITVNSRIKNDVTLIAASTGEVGNNVNAMRLAALQSSTNAVSSTSFADYLHQVSSALGEEAGNAYKEEESFTALETNIANRRDEVSGVNVDEELVSMIRFQQAYQASAKYISTVNQLTDFLLRSV